MAMAAKARVRPDAHELHHVVRDGRVLAFGGDPQNFQEFCKQLRDQAGGMKVDYHLMRTDEPVEKALGIYLTKRQNRV